MTEPRRIDILRRLGNDQESLISELLAIDRKLGKSNEVILESLVSAQRTAIALAKNHFRSLQAERPDPDSHSNGVQL